MIVYIACVSLIVIAIVDPIRSFTTGSKLNQDWKTIFPPVTRPVTYLEDVSRSNFKIYQQPHQFGSLYKHMLRHAIIQLNDGNVIVYNPIAPTEETLYETEQAFKKKPDHVIVPTNSYEHLVMVPGWTKAFPEAVFWGLPGVDLDGALIRKDLTDSSFPVNWSNEIAITVLNGGYLFKECYLLHKPSRTVFSLDSFNQITEEHILNRIGELGITVFGSIGVPFCSTKMLIWNKSDSKKAIDTVLSWDFDRVISSHGICPINNGKEAIRSAFQFLN